MQEEEQLSKSIDKVVDRLQKGLLRLSDNDAIFSERYSNNIKAIEEFFPEVFEVIKDYEPKNKNIFLEEDGALNILFPESGYTLFSELPFSQIEKKYGKFKSSPSRTFVDIDTEISNRCRHEYYLSRIHVKKREMKNSVEVYDELPSIIGGIVLFGFDLGYQLIKILDNHFARHIYIYEEDIDLFYYSLFAIDWVWVVNEMKERDSTIHLFLGITEQEFSNHYISHIRYNGLYMAAHTYLYMGYSYKHIESVLDEFWNQYIRQVIGWGFFDDGIIGIGQYLSRKTTTYLAVKPDYNFPLGFDKNINMPVFILGNGPSLDANIEFVRENIENAVLVCCGTTLNTLKKYGIKPDYHVDVERMRHTAEKLEFVDPDFLSDVIALTVNVMHPDFYNYFDKSVIGLKPSEPVSSLMLYGSVVSASNRSRLMEMSYSSPIVANLALSYMTQMGFSDVYLIGVDCGFRNPDEHHSKVSGYYKNDGANTGLVTYDRNLHKRPANFGGYAYTTSIMDASRVQLELLIRSAKAKNKLFQCYNLSDGIKIEGSEALRSDDALIAISSSGVKKQVKDYVWKHCVAEENDSYGERDIGDVADSFENMTKECLAILDKGFKDKKELLVMLAEFNSLIMKQYFLGRPINCDLMIGSFTYFANELVDLVLSSPEDTFLVANEMMELFKEFINEMPGHLRNSESFVDSGSEHLTGRYNA